MSIKNTQLRIIFVNSARADGKGKLFPRGVEQADSIREKLSPYLENRHVAFYVAPEPAAWGTLYRLAEGLSSVNAKPLEGLKKEPSAYLYTRNLGQHFAHSADTAVLVADQNVSIGYLKSMGVAGRGETLPHGAAIVLDYETTAWLSIDEAASVELLLPAPRKIVNPRRDSQDAPEQNQSRSGISPECALVVS